MQLAKVSFVGVLLALLHVGAASPVFGLTANQPLCVWNIKGSSDVHVQMPGDPTDKWNGLGVTCLRTGPASHGSDIVPSHAVSSCSLWHL